MNEELSVLMSVYFKEKPEYLECCFESLLNQTVQAKEWVIVKDGPLTDELNAVITSYKNANPLLIKIVELKKNVGLGLALREGILNCKFDIVARMDTDDIAKKNRFELQLNEFSKDPALDLCGSHIIEFDQELDDVLSRRKVPLAQNDIINYQKRRSAFNHMTVMFKKEKVLEAGNYEHCPLMEDDMLWVRMILANAHCKNLDDYLVYARAGTEMINRRGGWQYFKKYREGRKKIYSTGFISYKDYLLTVYIQFVSACLPMSIRKMIFLKLLRNED